MHFLYYTIFSPLSEDGLKENLRKFQLLECLFQLGSDKSQLGCCSNNSMAHDGIKSMNF